MTASYRNTLALSLLLVFSLTLPLLGQPAADAVSGITSRQIEGHIRFLASDLLEGRDTASVGERLAASYISNQLSRIGFEPAGDPTDDGRSWFQAFPMHSTTPQLEGCSFELLLIQGGDALQFQVNQDFYVSPRSLASGQSQGGLVFAGHGIVSKDHDIDDYAGISVEGSFVLILAGNPEGVVAGEGRNRSRALGMRARQQAAKDRGAVGLVVIHAAEAEETSFSEDMGRSVRAFGRRSLSMNAGGSRQIPTIYLEDSARDQIAAIATLTTESEYGEVAGLIGTFNIEVERKQVDAFNVVSLMKGSDPELANEVIVYSAHYDHLGVGRDGNIYNGADDNASGSSALIEIAEAFAEGSAPPRSILILHVSGEEKGLLGSRWFVEHNPLPEQMKMIADINLDMIGRNNPTQIGITPSPKHEHWSSLNEAAADACEEEGLEPTYDVDSYYGRTDSYNFAKQGIPSIFLFSGVHEDYHRVSDESDKINFTKAAAVSRVAFRLGWHLAWAKQPPVRKSPNSETGNR
ncbi:MAG TPA: M20/M25/M40 family metallo-hydrolase [Planctomycetes bacterium]|nr:M20/M25/M40 family metallo-hydrolase [Planctomycetota bacterium]